MTRYVREITAVYRKQPIACDAPSRALDSPNTVAELCTELIGWHADERFIVLHLDARNRLRSYCLAGVGSVSVCSVSPVQVFKPALLANAAAIVVAHNHPSGDPKPSPDDDRLTERLCRGAELLDLAFLDHVIVTVYAGAYYSYAHDGRLPRGGVPQR